MFIDYDRLMTALSMLPENKREYDDVIQVVNEVAAIELYDDWKTQLNLADQKEHELEQMECKIGKYNFLYTNYVVAKG